MAAFRVDQDSVDPVVSYDDFEILVTNFNTTGNGWADGDLNGDCAVDLAAFLIFDANYPWGGP